MSLPTGTVTFLFTDIEGSTRLWEEQPDAMRLALARLDDIVSSVVPEFAGTLVKSRGEGDSHFTVFALAADAVAAAAALQSAYACEPWPGSISLKVRMALHTGDAGFREGDYYGQAVNRCARLRAISHGGQILLSDVTHDLCCDSLPGSCTLKPLGEHRLKNLGRPEAVFQLCHPGLPADFPPLRSLDNPDLKHNLPLQLTSFIGREKELSEVGALLGKSRLVTLTGSGGCGKTRLSLQVAADTVGSLTDGVWLAELAALSDPGLVPQHVASVLGIKEEPGKPILQSLIDYLKPKHLLLVLDNCEHLLDACAKLADPILRSCPGVRILATSREGLGIAGETTYRVPSLPLPDPKQHQTPESVSHYDSVRLFIERAVQSHAGFTVTNENAPALASVCQRLDGIPLAIELAAARIRSLTVEDINARLDQRFRLLTGGSRTALPRQQTLRSLIDWSYDLLNASEKTLLCRLSVFSGGWTLESAEQVCAGEPVEDWEVLDLLTSLADKSLVVVDSAGSASRYRLLETVRQYARDRLMEAGESEIWRNRHLSHFLALAEDTWPRIIGEQRQFVDRVEAEYDNLRAALDWSESANPEEGLRLAGAVSPFWEARGHLFEGRDRLARALAAAPHAEKPVRAGLILAASWLALGLGDPAALKAISEEGIAIFRDLGDRSGMATSMNHLGLAAYARGDYVAARTLYEESLAIFRDLGDRWGIAYSLENLGRVAHSQGDYVTARSLLEESLAIKRDVGDRNGIAYSLDILGTIACELGDYAVARALHDESGAIFRELGDRKGMTCVLLNLGKLAREEADYPAARALLKDSLSIFREIGTEWGIAVSLEELAAAASSLGEPYLAVRLWGAGERFREENGTPMLPDERSRHDARVSAARVAFADDAAFDSAWADGRAMTLDQAIELSLRE